MAVVFISPKQRQKTFFMGITAVFLLLLVIFSSWVFLSGPKKPESSQLVFNKPKVDINMDVFDSPQFKDLQSFTQMETLYSYTAVTKDKKTRTGSLSASSMDKAKSILQGMGLTLINIKEVEIGRDNPFTPYYESVSKVNTKK